MIGLRRGTVKLVPHHRAWGRLFEIERQRLKRKLGKRVMDIQHIGSTAIPGIPAKPIIDISMGIVTMRPRDVRTLVRPLAELGYELRREFGRPDRQPLFVKGPERERTHYLHVMKHNGVIWKNDLLFRDYLRRHRNAAQRYAALKQTLAKRFADDRGSYTARKSKFVLATITKARKTRGDHR